MHGRDSREAPGHLALHDTECAALGEPRSTQAGPTLQTKKPPPRGRSRSWRKLTTANIFQRWRDNLRGRTRAPCGARGLHGGCLCVTMLARKLMISVPRAAQRFRATSMELPAHPRIWRTPATRATLHTGAASGRTRKNVVHAIWQRLAPRANLVFNTGVEK
jgi:hypothetical protein